MQNQELATKQANLMQATGLSPRNLLAPEDPQFLQPTAEQVSAFFYYVNHSIKEIGQILGLKDEARGRYWVKPVPKGGKPMPGGYWDYLLLRFGLVNRQTIDIKHKA